MANKRYSAQEIAEMLLQVIDNVDKTTLNEFLTTGIDGVEYIGQGIHIVYVERDTLLRAAGRMNDNGM